MASIRTRLTTTYALALAGTMVAFATATWLARGASGYRELQRYVNEEAEVATSLLRQARGPAGGLALTEVRDPEVGPLVVQRVQLLLDALPNIVIVTDTSGRLVYRSIDARLLRSGQAESIVATATQLTPTVAATLNVARDTSPGAIGAYVRALQLPAQDRVLVVRRTLPLQLAPLRDIVVATPTASSDRARRELFGAMLAIAPIVFGVSIGAAYFISGRTLQPLDQVVDAVEAITDGRSLHRRLAVDDAGDELARLSATLNAMIGRLETSFGALRRFTADASHELKTPLTVLRANVERSMALGTSAEQLESLEEALQEITRMADLVDSLLTLARFDEGRFDLHRVPVPLEPLVQDVYETALILGEASGLRIVLAAAEPATVLGDATRLRQLFLNLAMNAIKYTPRGEVELSLRVADGTAIFGVRDTGIGIAAADLPYIFDRFWRADRARSRRPTEGALPERGGFGLGLAISQWITQAHGGTIAVNSRLTRGTTFTVTLPVPTQAELEAAAVEG